MKLGIVGLPNVGKSTLFNALTRAGAPSANYPFCTIEPNYGVVSVPDSRLDYLAKVYYPRKAVSASIEFVDIAGLVKGAGKGEGLGNKFLSHIREVDAVIEVVRCFEDAGITHVDGSIDPLRDVTVIDYELIFADMETIERHKAKAGKMIKTGDKKYAAEVAVCDRLLDELGKENFARNIEWDEKEQIIADGMLLLTGKPVIYAANISEDQAGEAAAQRPDSLMNYAKQQGSDVVFISAKLEEELAGLDDGEKELFMEELGVGEPGLYKLIKKSYALLGLISYLTVGEKEVRAWTVKKGTKAPRAAGKIHSDFERGFIKAEVIAFDKLKKLGGNMLTAKEAGEIRHEGKEYEIKDGDVVLFRFNV